MIMGAPATVVRTLTEEQIAGLAWSAQHYQDNAAYFASHLVAL